MHPPHSAEQIALQSGSACEQAKLEGTFKQATVAQHVSWGEHDWAHPCHDLHEEWDGGRLLSSGCQGTRCSMQRTRYNNAAIHDAAGSRQRIRDNKLQRTRMQRTAMQRTAALDSIQRRGSWNQK